MKTYKITFATSHKGQWYYYVNAASAKKALIEFINSIGELGGIQITKIISIRKDK